MRVLSVAMPDSSGESQLSDSFLKNKAAGGQVDLVLEFGSEGLREYGEGWLE